MTEGIISVSQGGAKKARIFVEFRSQTSRGRDFRESRGYHGRPVQVIL